MLNYLLLLNIYFLKNILILSLCIKTIPSSELTSRSTSSTVVVNFCCVDSQERSKTDVWSDPGGRTHRSLTCFFYIEIMTEIYL